jgi:hypothetical protein
MLRARPERKKHFGYSRLSDKIILLTTSLILPLQYTEETARGEES